MTDYLTEYGKNTVRELYFEVQAKKQELREKGVDVGSYEYQAIQQREIAMDTLFTDLITASSENLIDEDTTSYYDYLAKEHKKPSFNSDLSGSKLTVEGYPKVLSLYKEELIATAAAWHDGIFTYLPSGNDIGNIEPCSVNYNFLERQQGFRIALKALDVPAQTIRMVEDDVRNGVYTLEMDPNGGNSYVELIHYDSKEQD